MGFAVFLNPTVANDVGKFGFWFSAVDPPFTLSFWSPFTNKEIKDYFFGPFDSDTIKFFVEKTVIKGDGAFGDGVVFVIGNFDDFFRFVIF